MVLIVGGLVGGLTGPLEAPPTMMNSPGSQSNPTMLGGDPPCLPLDCAAVSVAAPPGFPYPDPASFVPDRRPAQTINLFGGACGNPPIGGPVWWHDLNDADSNGLVDGVDTLLDRLDDEYADGWRRMLMVLPAGSYTGIMASSQWWTMPQTKRDSLTAALPAWLAAHPDATLGVYVGFAILDPCKLCMNFCWSCIDCNTGAPDCDVCVECTGMPSAHLPLSTVPDDMCIVHQNIEPWITAGIDEMWFDHAGGADTAIWDAMLRLAGNPDYTGRIQFVTEPIIIDGQGGGANEPVPDALNRMASVSLRRYFEIFGANAPIEAWTFDPATTEVHAMFRDDEYCIDQVPGDGDPCTDCPDWCGNMLDSAGIDVVYDYMQRGYVPQPRGAMSAEYVRRILDQNVTSLPCPRDLDADGDVDADDADRLATNIGMTTAATLYHGDVDFDDDVDIIDYFLLVSHEGFPGPCN